MELGSQCSAPGRVGVSALGHSASAAEREVWWLHSVCSQPPISSQNIRNPVKCIFQDHKLPLHVFGETILSYFHASGVSLPVRRRDANHELCLFSTSPSNAVLPSFLWRPVSLRPVFALLLCVSSFGAVTLTAL
jgi:hypothetical protein